MYSVQRTYGPPIPPYHHHVSQYRPHVMPMYNQPPPPSFQNLAVRNFSPSPPNFGDRRPPAAPKSFHYRRPSQPFEKSIGREVLSHCFRFRDAPFLNFSRDVVFVAHDFEAYTPAHSGKRPITEAGIAFFDTRVLDSVVDPGQHGENWLNEILAAHLRVEDRGHLINRHWAQSCGHQFDFGQSQWAPIEDMKNLLDRSIRIPDRENRAINARDMSAMRDMSGQPPVEPDLRNRNVILVSHAFHNDDGYMKTPDLNFDYNAYGTVVGIVDTQVIGAREGFEGMRFPALKRLCGNFNIDQLHPHNAGNDAAYTMISLVLLALEDAHLQKLRVGRGPTNAAPAVNELMKRSKKDYIRYWLTKAPAQGYRCEICGRKNSHGAEECELRTKCEQCGCFGHREDRCQPQWMENAKLGYGNPKSFATPEDKIKHEFAAMVRAAAKASEAPVPLAENGHSPTAIEKAFPLLPAAPSSSSGGSDTASPTSTNGSFGEFEVKTNTLAVDSVIARPPPDAPTAPAKDREVLRTQQQHIMGRPAQFINTNAPRANDTSICIVSGTPQSSSPRYTANRLATGIDSRASMRRGKKRNNWMKLELRPGN